MAIDPRISLQVQAPQVSQAINIFENALMNKQTRNLRASQEARAAELQPFRNQILQQQVAAGEAQAAQAQDQRILKSINDFAVTNQHIIDEAERSGDFAPLQQAMVQRRAQLVQSGLPTDETDEAILSLGQGDIQSLDIIDQLRNARQLFNQQSGKGQTAEQRGFNSKVQAVKNDPNLETVEGRAAAVALGLAARKSSSAQIEIAKDPVLTDAVAKSESQIEGEKSKAKEDAKFRSKKKFAAEINRDIKLAEAEAAARGETLTDLSRAKAALPGIEKVVGKLTLLADEATFTLAGGAWDSIAKQLFGVSTKGSTARAKMVSMVDNQVLPMLKPIFGAAFTAAEGDRLRDAMLDPDSTPESRKAQLASFLDQMRENIAGKERELADRTRISDTTSFGGGAAPAQGSSIDISDPSITIEQLIAERKRLGGQ